MLGAKALVPVEDPSETTFGHWQLNMPKKVKEKGTLAASKPCLLWIKTVMGSLTLGCSFFPVAPVH